MISFGSVVYELCSKYSKTKIIKPRVISRFIDSIMKLYHGLVVIRLYQGLLYEIISRVIINNEIARVIGGVIIF